MNACPLQHKDDLGTRTGGYAEWAKPVMTRDAVSVAKYGKLQDLADPLLATDEVEMLVGRAINRHRYAGT